jgi:hypothetical protein
MSEIGNWESGAECERHMLAYCADCRDLAGIIRRHDGSLGFDNDCSVQSFAEITGASYDEAADLLRDQGFKPSGGTPYGRTEQAFKSAGYTVTCSTVTLTTARQLSESGRAFLVLGTKGKTAHAWSITDGKINRSYRPPFRYQVFEITA